MESLDYWRLCDELTIVEAALLVSGHDPSIDATYVERWEAEKRPAGYEGAKNAISRALQRKQIEGTIVEEPEYDNEGNVYGSITGSMDIKTSRVFVDSLRLWLSARGISSGFFFPNGSNTPDYLDPSHPRYAPKLAAAVRAWLATDDETMLRGKTAKQALSIWLRKHAAQFGLTNDDGNPIDTGVEEIAKVANWKPGGGAPKTPS